MTRLLLASAALLLVAVQGQAQDVTEIDKPASTLEKIFAEKAELAEGEQEVRVVTATLDPMTAGAWHLHPTPVYIYVMEGELTLEVEGKETRVAQAGEALAEPLDANMRAVNKTDTPARLVIFQISPAEKEFLEQEKTN